MNSIKSIKQRWYKVFSWIAGSLGVLFLLMIAVVFYILYTERGTRYAWETAVVLSDQHLNGTLDGGTLRTGVKLHQFRWHDANIDVQIDEMRGRWTFSPSPLHLVVDFLQINTIDLKMTASNQADRADQADRTQKKSSHPPTLPKDLNLTLPFQFEIRHFHVNRLRWHQDKSILEVNDLTLQAGTDGHHSTLIYKFHEKPDSDIPLSGAGTVQFMGARMLDSNAKLSMAGNQLTIHGSFGEVGDRLVFRLNAPCLKPLGFGLAGSVDVAGDLRGTFAHPRITAKVQADALVAGENRVGYLRAHTQWRDGLHGAMVLNVDARQLTLPHTLLRALQIHLKGTRAQHALAANVTGQVDHWPIDLDIHAHGRLTDLAEAGKGRRGHGSIRWDGKITQFVNHGLPAVQLKLPVAISAESNPNHMTVGTTRLSIDNAMLNLRKFIYQRGNIRSAGSFTGIDINRLYYLFAMKTVCACNAEHIEQYQQCQKLALAGASAAPSSLSALSTDLVVDSDWDFSIGRTATGYWQLQRRLGDVKFKINHEFAALDLSELAARVNFSDGNRAHLMMHAKSARIGTVDANLQALLSQANRNSRLTVTPQMPLSGQLVAMIPSLKTTGSLLGPKYVLDGQLALKLGIAGSMRKPVFSGSLNGDHLLATLIDEGATLREGVIRIAIADNWLNFKQLTFHGAHGTLSATGRVQLAPLPVSFPAEQPHRQPSLADQREQEMTSEKPSANTNGTGQPSPVLSAKIIADKFEPFAVPYRQLSLSGHADIVNSAPEQALAIDGKFTVDHAFFDLPEKSAPQLGADVQIVGAHGDLVPTGRQADNKMMNRFMPRANIAIDFGHDFRFRGVGANVMLGGKLKVTSAPKEPLRAVGDLHMRYGSTYEIFGRKLQIEKGYFTFNGPIDNPGINILAMRRNQEVEAGVAVTGPLAMPNSKLVSEPNVPDDEKLSWLLFGHGTGSGINLGQQSTMTAALALLGSTGGKRIAKTLGVDEFSVGRSESGLTDPQVISLAKAMNEHLILGYEQGLTSAANLFKATWQFSRRWALAAYTGAINGVDLIFSRHFD